MMTSVAGSLKAVPQIVTRTEVTEIIASGATVSIKKTDIIIQTLYIFNLLS